MFGFVFWVFFLLDTHMVCGHSALNGGLKPELMKGEVFCYAIALKCPVLTTRSCRFESTCLLQSVRY